MLCEVLWQQILCPHQLRLPHLCPWETVQVSNVSGVFSNVRGSANGYERVPGPGYDALPVCSVFAGFPTGGRGQFAHSIATSGHYGRSGGMRCVFVKRLLFSMLVALFFIQADPCKRCPKYWSRLVVAPTAVEKVRACSCQNSAAGECVFPYDPCTIHCKQCTDLYAGCWILLVL